MDLWWTSLSVLIGMLWHTWRNRQRIKKRRMIKFSSIEPQLHAKIAEKMDFLDQKQFELSSQQGKQIGSQRKQKSVLKVTSFNMTKKDIFFTFKLHKRESWGQWSNLREIHDLPLFKVSQLRFNGSCALISIAELGKNTKFMQNGVILRLEDKETSSAEVFIQLCKIFNITKICSMSPPDSTFYSLPFHSEMELELPVNVAPEVILKLKCKNIRLCDKSNPSQTATIANLFFEEWYQKKRSIDNFAIFTTSSNALKMENVFSKIQFSILWQYKGQLLSKYRLLRAENVTGSYCPLGKGDFVCATDRGDKKLVVFVWEKINFIQAYECDNVKDIIDIQW